MFKIYTMFLLLALLFIFGLLASTSQMPPPTNPLTPADLAAFRQTLQAPNSKPMS